jgi:hypothetical protein
MRSLPPSVASLVTLYEEITEAGDVTFEWPAVPPGTQATFELTQAPAESTATASLSGVLDGADLPGAYVLERTCSLMGHAVRKDVAVALYDGGSSDLTAPTPPVAQSLDSSATTASVTYTHPGAPAGVTYALTVTDEADAEVTPDSGSGLGAWVFPVASDKAYAATIEATGTDGQTSQSTALVKVAAAGGAYPRLGYRLLRPDRPRRRDPDQRRDDRRHARRPRFAT